MRPIIQSKKHINQESLATVGTGAVGNFVIATPIGSRPCPVNKIFFLFDQSCRAAISAVNAGLVPPGSLYNATV